MWDSEWDVEPLYRGERESRTGGVERLGVLITSGQLAVKKKKGRPR